MFYVYLHKTLDTNEVFYIGKGFGSRAFKKIGRNNYWKNIVEKHGYKVEIVLDNLTEEEALLQERLGQMELSPRANIKRCGIKEGAMGVRWSEEQKAKHSIAMKKKNEKHPAWNKGMKGSNKANMTTFNSENSKGERNKFFGKKHTEENLKIIGEKSKKMWNDPNLREKVVSGLKTYWDNKEKREEMAIKRGSKRFYVFKNGELIGSWVNKAECARELGISKSGIIYCLNGKAKSQYEYSFKYLIGE